MNSLQKQHNYYEKYMKYKTKYIEYKNKLLVVNGKKREGGRSMYVLNGGGYNANIQFYTDIRLKNQVKGITDITDITSKKSLYIKITSILPFCVYQFIEKVGEGTTGTVFKIVPLPAQSEPEMFVIKLTAGILPGEPTENTMEGINIDKIPVPPRVKALFQGNTERVDFAIFNYLGQDLETFLRYNSSTMTAPIILSLITIT